MKKQLISIAIALTLITAVFAPVSVSADEWVKTDKGYVYEYDNGTTAAKGWLKIDGKTYYIQKDGTRKTGWLKTSSGAKYYFDKNGVMYKSKWVKMKSGTKYYFLSNGKAATGVVTIDKTEYKFDTDGAYLGKNNHYILNTETLCLHTKNTCTAAQKIDKENYDEVDIGSEEFDEYSENGYWGCGICNKNKALPKPKK